VSENPSEHLAGWESLRGALGEIHACCADFEHFFGDVCGQLGSMAGELAEQQQLWNTRQEQAAKELQQQADDSAKDDNLLQDRCRQLEQQHTQLQQERREMESQLETVRNRAAEMTDAVAEQKRIAEKQQAQWSGELKRMRRLLEGISGAILQREAVPYNGDSQPQAQPNTTNNHHTTDNPDTANNHNTADDPEAADADPVLDSVLAQFELLQQDLAQRRAKHS